MTNRISITYDASGLGEGLSEAGDEIERVAREQIAPAALIIEDAFATAAGSIQSNLARAAEEGEVSLKRLTSALQKDLRRFAIDAFVRKPIESLISNLLAAPFGGARAAGGAVAPGQSFLVGERGPELFTPAAVGRVSPMGAGAPTVHIHLPGVTDAESFGRSETQIAAALARAVGRGQRNL
jgi:phage-related minor tail protein